MPIANLHQRLQRNSKKGDKMLKNKNANKELKDILNKYLAMSDIYKSIFKNRGDEDSLDECGVDPYQVENLLRIYNLCCPYEDIQELEGIEGYDLFFNLFWQVDFILHETMENCGQKTRLQDESAYSWVYRVDELFDSSTAAVMQAIDAIHPDTQNQETEHLDPSQPQ